MAYVIIYDHGYEGYSYNEFNNMDELLDDYSNRGSMDIAEIYEISRDISKENIEYAIAKREAAREAAIVKAKAKLTTDECRLLGIA